jgi:poly-gamma-glutamate synthesis protein (capsule biosynthesis protein)
LLAALVSLTAASASALAAMPGLEVTFVSLPTRIVGHATAMTIRVENKLPGTAIGVTLRVDAPSWVRLTSKGCIPRRAGLACVLRDLEPGEGVVVRIRVWTTRLGTYRVIAQAAAKFAEPHGVASPLRQLAGPTGFRGTIAPISPALTRKMTGVSWRPGCPVSLRDLRLLTLSYRDFSGRTRTGRLIVHGEVARQVVRIFARLFAAGFPIRRMVPVDAYGGDDYRSIEADNTSAFNCRPVAGTARWSEHAYGRAIDLDPLENPYVSGGGTSHPASRRYLDRSLRLAGMIHAGDEVVRAFAAEGWGWGGVWRGSRDYQHFSASGR